MPPRALSPTQENLYSTLTRENEFVNIAALSMSTNSIYDNAKTSTRNLCLEPMYIDVAPERPTTRKSSRRLKCLVVWLVMLTIISLTSLAFTTLMIYKASMANGNAMFFGDSSSATDGKDFSKSVILKKALQYVIFCANVIVILKQSSVRFNIRIL